MFRGEGAAALFSGVARSLRILIQTEKPHLRVPGSSHPCLALVLGYDDRPPTITSICHGEGRSFSVSISVVPVRLFASCDVALPRPRVPERV